MLPAVSDARLVVSTLSISPAAAMSWPFLSTMKTTLAFASRTKRSTTTWIWLNSSSYITICGLTIRALDACQDRIAVLALVFVCYQSRPEASLRFDSLRSLAPLRQDVHLRHSLGSGGRSPLPPAGNAQPGIQSK